MTRATKNILKKVKVPSLSNAADIVDLGVNLFSIFVAVGAAFGLIAKSGAGSHTTFSIDFGSLSLTFRLVIFLILAAAFGWGLGALILRLTAARIEYLTVTSYVVSLIWGILMVATADWLATSKTGSHAIAFPIFTVFGLALMLWLVIFQLRAVTASASATIVLTQSRSILIATIGVILAYFLNLISSL